MSMRQGWKHILQKTAGLGRIRTNDLEISVNNYWHTSNLDHHGSINGLILCILMLYYSYNIDFLEDAQLELPIEIKRLNFK